MSAPTRPRRSTSTAAHREPLPIEPHHIIPPERRDTVEAPCVLCDRIKQVRFDDGLCAGCREVTARSRAADEAQNQRLRRAGARW